MFNETCTMYLFTLHMSKIIGKVLTDIFVFCIPIFSDLPARLIIGNISNKNNKCAKLAALLVSTLDFDSTCVASITVTFVKSKWGDVRRAFASRCICKSGYHSHLNKQTSIRQNNVRELLQILIVKVGTHPLIDK